MKNDLLYQLALTQVPLIGAVHAKTLARHFGSAEAIFKARNGQLEKVEGIGTARAAAIKSFAGFTGLETEILFIEKYNILPLFITDAGYPQRLVHCYDPPTLLFYKGKANLNASHIIAIIGTRHSSDYGRQVTEKLVQELAGMDVLIVSGLAYGIDGLAHKAALKYELPTVGVLGHGLDTIYPSQHTSLAKEMIKQEGGLLTEFCSNTKPDKHNFPARNRIVAGMSDATIVVETDTKGGSMITAELANGYNKDVFAFPGKITDTKSAGCNYLIKSNKAMLLTGAQDLIDTMGWTDTRQTNIKPQRNLFTELSEEEKKVAGILQEKGAVHIDELNMHSGLSSSAVAAAILNMELEGMIQTLPGKRYKLI
jgi:DNA processing protein